MFQYIISYIIIVGCNQTSHGIMDHLLALQEFKWKSISNLGNIFYTNLILLRRTLKYFLLGYYIANYLVHI